MQQLHAMAGESATAMQFGAAARARERAMSELMWSERRWQWLDVHWPSSTQVDTPSSASNWLPLWAGAFDERRARLAVKSLRHSGLVQDGGIATTLATTGHQWDWPNAWAPLQEMLIEGLERTGDPAAQALALRVARYAHAHGKSAHPGAHHTWRVVS